MRYSVALLADVRTDLLATRADTMAKNLTMTAEQAAKPWPVYDAYQEERSSLVAPDMRAMVRSYSSADAARRRVC